MDTLNKVKDWAEAKKSSARFVASDSNVTYEDILKVCELAEKSVPEPTAKSSSKHIKVENVTDRLDNKKGS